MAETENMALGTIKRIHNELGDGESAEKLRRVIKIITEETGAVSAEMYVKADEIYFHENIVLVSQEL